jgi:predicted  nucleic acid-binding Zn-ribbon protein
MSDEHPTIGDLTYELLKKMRAEQQEMRLDMLDLKMRATATEEHLAALVMSNSGTNHRLDRIEERVGRVERRLELRDGAEA